MIARSFFRLWTFVFPLAVFGAGANERTLSAERLREAVEGYWIGQLAGNYIGFPFENLYQEEPIPVLVERYYTWEDAEREGLMMNVNDRRAFLPILADALGGAWSDDDSDIVDRIAVVAETAILQNGGRRVDGGGYRVPCDF